MLPRTAKLHSTGWIARGVATQDEANNKAHKHRLRSGSIGYVDLRPCSSLWSKPACDKMMDDSYFIWGTCICYSAGLGIGIAYLDRG